MCRWRNSAATRRSSRRPKASAARETSSRVGTTRSAPAPTRRSRSSRRATPSAAMAPALAACTPLEASSTTKQSPGSRPSSRAAVRKIIGSGLPLGKSRPEMSASNSSSRVIRGRMKPYSSRCSAAKRSRRIRDRNSLAFLDDDAAATRIPMPLTTRMNRSASGKAMNRPSSINRTICSCLAAAYRSARASTSGTPKCSRAARAPAIRGLPAMTRWYTAEVNRSGVQLVWSRTSPHSVSIRTRNDSRQDSSWGESTSTPSTSKIAPRYTMTLPPYYSVFGATSTHLDSVWARPSGVPRKAHRPGRGTLEHRVEDEVQVPAGLGVDQDGVAAGRGEGLEPGVRVLQHEVRLERHRGPRPGGAHWALRFVPPLPHSSGKAPRGGVHSPGEPAARARLASMASSMAW